jgi:hypothetical protein
MAFVTGETSDHNYQGGWLIVNLNALLVNFELPDLVEYLPYDEASF